MMKTIEQNYRASAFYEDYKNEVCEILNSNNFCDMNIEFIKFILREFDINTSLYLQSDLKGIKGSKNNLIVEIGKHFEADVYLSGQGAKKYNNENQFLENGIQILYQNFKHPLYNQLHPPFVSHLSILDLLFNQGKNGKRYIKK